LGEDLKQRASKQGWSEQYESQRLRASSRREKGTAPGATVWNSAKNRQMDNATRENLPGEPNPLSEKENGDPGSG